ncbi:MAG: DUF1566 domain-containing protein [Halieaceae bacterium]|nr:DUF1566 domain-containing protein [Halieaceae bacterium]
MKNHLQKLILACLLGAVPVHGVAQTCFTESEMPSSTPTAHFTDHGNGTVTHDTTGLMWAKCVQGASGSDCTTGSVSKHTWQQALDTAAASTLAAYADWRLPNMKELRSIVEEQCDATTINLAIFPNARSSHYWSASPYARFTGVAWFVDFYSGISFFTDHGSSKYIRLVRSQP